MNLAAAAVLSGAALNNKLQRLRNTERETISEIIQALSEMYTRRYYLELGYSSLFDYCTRGLGYSESGAFRRISVAKCVRSFPEVLRHIQTGKLNLTTASLVAPHLLVDEVSPRTLMGTSLSTSADTTRKAFELIELVAGKTQNQVKEILALKAGPQSVGRAVLKPGEKVRLVVHATTHGSKTPFATRHQSSAHPGSTDHRENTAQGENSQAISTAPNQHSTSLPSLFDSPTKISGITDENSIDFRKQTQAVVRNGEESNAAVRYELKFSVSKECQRKLDRARVKLSGKYPRGASLEVTLEELLDSYLEKQTPKERTPRAELPNRGEVTSVAAKGSRSRHIPAAVRRQVFKRDNGACAYVSPEGVTCGCEWDVELDHIVPFSKGGAHTAENLRVLCRAHNNRRNEIAGA